jgi:hypothetical protein
MGPQVRMAGSLSINKRKTYAADTRDVIAACPRRSPRGPASRSGARRLRRGWDFHGFAR